MPLKAPWKRNKKVPGKNVKGGRVSFFSDQVIRDCSVGQSMCELYFPEPSITFDEFGAIKDVCISGDSVTLLWSKHCTVHLCEIPNVPSDFTVPLEDTGQDCEVCLNVVLNRCTSGDFSYSIRDRHWHECSIKSGKKWQRFVLQLHGPNCEQFETQLENTLQLVQESKEACLYLLVAVQTKVDKRQSLHSEKKQTRVSLLNLPQAVEQSSETETLPRSSISEDSSDDTDSETVVNSLASSEKESEEKKHSAPLSLVPPFDPAPYIPDGYLDEGRLQSSVDELKESKHLKSLLCDSLHIHPNEFPQTLQSILISALSTQGDSSHPNAPVSPATNPENPVVKTVRTISRNVTDKNDERCDSRLKSGTLTSEELYLPMGVIQLDKSERNEKTNMADQVRPNPKLQKCQQVAELLSTAINSNDVGHAQEYAKQLAEEPVIVTVDVKMKPNTPDQKSNEFNLKVNVEDKEVSGGSIILKVKATDTIRDLKNTMLIKHQFPVEVQNWIIGKRIPADNETLYKNRIRDAGCTAFLYLVSANSAGVDKEEFMRKQAMLFYNPDLAGATPGAVPDLLVTPSSTGSRKTSSATPGSSASAGPGDTPKNKLNTAIPKENMNIQKGGEKQLGARTKLPVPGIDRGKSPTGGGQMNISPDVVKERRIRQPVEDEEPVMNNGWSCPACTYINQPTRPGCEVCSNPRPPTYTVPDNYVMTEDEKVRLAREEMIEIKTREAQERERQDQIQQSQENFQYLQQTDTVDVIPNTHEFQCPICFDDIEVGEGVVLRECLHSFCKECLKDAVLYNEEPVLKCPYTDERYSCGGLLQEREVKGLVTPEIFAKYLARSLSTAESQAQNSFHCKTADCPGWCIYEDLVNFFVCQVCGKENCLTCKAIHTGMNCKQYQDDLKHRANNDRAANQTQMMIKKMLDDGDAMNCPQCQVIVMKKEGCDWIQCSICKTEICWVTKGPRWGPLGTGDISGGCRCRVNGVMCDPDCNNCH